MQAFLLPAYDHDTRGSDREAAQVSLSTLKDDARADMPLRYDPSERARLKAQGT